MTTLPIQLGPYTIDREIGRGGMGVVYLGRDTKLDRPVAIKSLPEHLAGDRERLARFEREAKLLASLTHPNVAGVYGLEDHDGAHYLVMEYVEGETLGDLIRRGPLPMDEALRLAVQIASGVEAAHEAGVIHRDLKPGNIVVTPRGQAKVLDFGLAKEVEGRGSSLDLSQSPTATMPRAPSHHTAEGQILGTPAYLSPEQARGKQLDKRTDIWSFGCVLFEMLTGASPYRGETATDSLGAILHKEPEWRQLPASTPPTVQLLLKRMLAKDQDRRLRDIGDARVELDEALRDPSGTSLGLASAALHTPGDARAAKKPVGVLATVVVGIAIGAGAMLLMPEQAREAPIVRSSILPPEGAGFHLSLANPGPSVISPDGSAIAFSAREDGGAVRIWVRHLDEDEARPLSGTEGAQYPFWSPDSRNLGFFARNRLRRIPVGGGPVLTIAEASNGKGGSWGDGDEIIFSAKANTTISRVGASGGGVTQLTTFDESRAHNSHRHPEFLPGGNAFLYLARTAATDSFDRGHEVWIASLDDPTGGKILTYSETFVRFSEGHVLLLRGGVLIAQPIDIVNRTLTGAPRPIADGVTMMTGAVAGVFSVSDTGILIYQAGNDVNQFSDRLWYDREGNEIGPAGAPETYGSIDLSRDGTKVATIIYDQSSGTGDIWLDDIVRGTRTRLTFEAIDEDYPIFNADETQITYQRAGNLAPGVYSIDVAGFGEPTLLLEGDPQSNHYPMAWSKDGRFLLINREELQGDPGTILLFDAESDDDPKPILVAPGFQGLGVFSPDGRFIAYVSDESGTDEVYVAPFPELTRKWPVSRGGGSWPVWADEGRELWFQTVNGTIMRTSIEVGESGVEIGAPEVVIELESVSNDNRTFDVSADGQRVIVVQQSTQTINEPLTLVQNWLRLLEQ